MSDLLIFSLIVSVLGSAYCLYRWDDLRQFDEKPNKEKRLILMYVASTMTFIILSLVFIVVGVGPV